MYSESWPSRMMRTFAPSRKLPDRDPAGLAKPAVRSGQPLPPALRAHYEEGFGHDFAQVRVHADDPQVEAQRAAAVTRGWHIAFAPGQWREGTPAGQRLLAHELAHVVQQTRPGILVPPHEAERQAEQAAARLSVGGAAPQLGATPHGAPAAAPPQPSPPQTQQTQIVPAAQVEKLAADIERVVRAANLPGINVAEIASVIAALRDYGNTGRVVWGQTDGAYGTYDPDTDLITLSSQRFDINNPGNVAAVAIFHEASHSTRRISAIFAEADLALEISGNPNTKGAIEAKVNWELKYFREETLAHRIDRQVLYSYFVETGVSTAQDAAKSVAGFDPTTGQSAAESPGKLVELLRLYSQETQREVDEARFLEDAHSYALTGEKMPDLRAYLR